MSHYQGALATIYYFFNANPHTEHSGSKHMNIDYENKIVIPTQQLYQSLSVQTNQLFEQIKNTAIELHEQVAQAGLELYNHPSETAIRWQAQVSTKADEAYATFNSEILPTVTANYHQLINNAADLNSRAQDALQFFINNPEKVTMEAFSSLSQAITLIMDKSMNVSADMLSTLSTQADKIISLLLEQPIETMESIYYDSLTALLNGYYNTITAILTSMT